MIPFLKGIEDVDVIRWNNRVLVFRPENVNLGQDGLFLKSGKFFDLNNNPDLVTFNSITAPLPEPDNHRQETFINSKSGCPMKHDEMESAIYWETDTGSHGWCCSVCGEVLQWG